jgi:hypothetical protein
MQHKRTDKHSAKEPDDEIKMIFSINYGDVTATVHADDENYVAKIQGKIEQVKDWRFHLFVLRFMQSLEKASNLNGPI